MNMSQKPVLIYKSNMTYFHTALPVYFYGMPDGSISLVYARFYEINFHNTGLEFVFAELEDFSYDFETGQIYRYSSIEICLDDFREMVDRPETRIKITKSLRNIDSYAEAQVHMNRMAGSRKENAHFQFV